MIEKKQYIKDVLIQVEKELDMALPDKGSKYEMDIIAQAALHVLSSDRIMEDME
jgi:hypothetical protein